MPIRDDLKVLKAVARLATARGEHRTARMYEMMHASGGTSWINDTTSYMNLGYWKPGCESLDEAAVAMVDLVADSGGFKPGDEILDVGFGYGDQTIRWAQTRDPGRIVAVDVTPVHVAIAQARAKENGLDDLVSFQSGSATRLDFASNSFDRVVALESAFYFKTREDFFRQANKVLRPGGVLVLADIIPATVPGKGISPPKPKDSISRTIDMANWYVADSYVERLRTAGFADVQLTSIGHEVLIPFRKYFAQRVMNDDLQASGIKGLLLKATRQQIRKNESLHAGANARPRPETTPLDYVIAVASKVE